MSDYRHQARATLGALFIILLCGSFFLWLRRNDIAKATVDSTAPITRDRAVAMLAELRPQNGPLAISAPPVQQDFTVPFLIGPQNWQLGVTQIVSPSIPDDSRIVLFLSGGPNAPSVDGDVLHRMTANYDNGQTTVFSISYSASSESQAARLLEHGMSAFDTDAQILSEFIHSIRKKEPQSQIILHAESLSTLLAIKCAGASKADIDALVLVSPWTHYLPEKQFMQSPYSYFGSGDFAPRSNRKLLNSYREAVLKYFRINEALETDPGRSWMEKVRDEIDLSGVLTIALIGEFEDRTPVSDTIEYLKAQNVLVQVEPGQFHSTVLTSDEGRARLAEFLSTISRQDKL